MINFPSSPSDGDTYTTGGRIWSYEAATNSWLIQNEGGIPSNTSLVLGSGIVTNIVSVTQATYDASTKSPTTLYIVISPVAKIYFGLIEILGGTSTPASPPTVSSFSPLDGATGVATGSDLVATFNEDIAIGSGNITIKNLTDATQTVITVPNAQVSVSGPTLTINPTANLIAGKSYAIQIAAGAVTDIAGAPFAGILNDTTWNFATAAIIPLTLASVSPTDGGTGTPTANLVATFSRDIAIGSGNITIKNLTDATQTVIAIGNPQCSIAGSTLTINPTANLIAGKSYAIQIASTCITDLVGVAFTGILNDTTWNFNVVTATEINFSFVNTEPLLPHHITFTPPGDQVQPVILAPGVNSVVLTGLSWNSPYTIETVSMDGGTPGTPVSVVLWTAPEFPPTIQTGFTINTATVGSDGLSLSLSFNDVLDIGSGATGFSVAGQAPADASVTASYVSHNAGTLELTLASVFYATETIKLTFVQSGTGVGDGTDFLPSFSNFAVINNSAVGTGILRDGSGLPVPDGNSRAIPIIES